VLALRERTFDKEMNELEASLSTELAKRSLPFPYPSSADAVAAHAHAHVHQHPHEQLDKAKSKGKMPREEGT
jgi:hypothetical protein